jgi:2-oxo-4-hydroxy-4-carboxy-5-ureidoimidazoline decarboxylase
MTLDEFNRCSSAAASAALRRCCAAERWVEGVVHCRPLHTEQELFGTADKVWRSMDEIDYLQAFSAHPKIGDVDSLRARYADTRTLAVGEQAGVNGATETVLQRLAAGNRDYEEKFGFIFIVCATGKTALQMLELLEQRLPHTRAEELPIAAAEQHKITRLRLQKMLATEDSIA